MSKEEEHICCICGKRFKGYGNNPEPAKTVEEGVCCNACNETVVMRARIEQIMDSWIEKGA